jgi:hypothetical protein
MINSSRLILILFLSCSWLTGLSQKDIINGEHVERIFRDPKDSSYNFYLTLEPTTSPKALLVILPGFGGYPREILEGTDIASKARKDGYLVVIPYLAVETFYADSISLRNLETLIPELMEKYKIPKNKFIIGGHSAGGNGALLYTAKSFREKKGELIRPALVFGVDPPLDLKRFRNTVAHEIEIGYRKKNIKGMKEFLAHYEGIFGGPPDQKSEVYEKYSAFYREAKDGGNTKYLKSVPVRLYCDPDVNWAIENLGVGYEHLNASDLSACIARLRLLGNKDATLVINLGKGYFSDGTRNPHASSQMNADEFLEWANSIID